MRHRNPALNHAIEPTPASGRRRALIAIAGLGVLLYTVFAIAADAGQLETAIVQLGVLGCTAVLVLSLLNYLLRFRRWQLYIAALGHDIPLIQHLLYYLGGFAFTVSPAKAGEAVRSVYLRDHGVRYAESIAALFVERLLDLLAMALLATLIGLDQPRFRPLLAIALLATIGLLLLVGRPALPTWLEKMASRRHGRIASALHHGATLLHSSRQLLRPKRLLSGLAFGLIAWGAEGIGFYMICSALQIDVTPATATGIYAIAALAGGAAFFMPGGIGGMEAVMASLLIALGAPLATAAIATLLCRLATLWFAVIIGLIAAAILETQNRTAPARTLP